MLLQVIPKSMYLLLYLYHKRGGGCIFSTIFPLDYFEVFCQMCQCYTRDTSKVSQKTHGTHVTEVLGLGQVTYDSLSLRWAEWKVPRRWILVTSRLTGRPNKLHFLKIQFARLTPPHTLHPSSTPPSTLTTPPPTLSIPLLSFTCLHPFLAHIHPPFHHKQTLDCNNLTSVSP